MQWSKNSRRRIMHEFHRAPIRGEGQPVEIFGKPTSPPEVETTYVERRIPVHLEKAAHRLIDSWLVSHGYDPREI
jgi:hypothetical protein